MLDSGMLVAGGMKQRFRAHNILVGAIAEEMQVSGTYDKCFIAARVRVQLFDGYSPQQRISGK